MKKGFEFFNLLNQKERNDFKCQFEFSNNKTLEQYLNEYFQDLFDFIFYAFEWGINEDYWLMVVATYAFEFKI